MGFIGEDSATEQNVDVAQIQARQILPEAILSALPSTNFVASINALSGLITIQAGTSSPGVTVTVSSDGVSTVSIGVTGIGQAATAKSNIAASAPTPSNDESEGYNYFSLWIDTTVPDVYMCVNPATMASVWLKLN
jgi:hypothetical protein